jgi:hypothetical protein
VLHALIPVTGATGEALLAPVCARLAPAALWDFSRDWLPHCPQCGQLTGEPPAGPTVPASIRHAPHMH